MNLFQNTGWQELSLHSLDLEIFLWVAVLTIVRLWRRVLGVRHRPVFWLEGPRR